MTSSTTRAFVAKKQSTTFAQVANNLLNVLQRYTKGIRFVAVLTILLTMGIGQAWAEGTENFEQLTNATDYKSRTWTGVNGQTWSATLARTDQKINGNRGLTFSNANSSATITMKLTDAQKAAGIGTFTFKYKHPYSDSGKTNTFSISVNGNNYSSGTINYTSSSTTKTITINAVPNSTSITITITGTARLCVDDFSWTSYVSAASYTVTYNANGGSGTMSNSTGSSIKIKECTFTAPECKQFTAWNTAANGSGTSYAPNATVATNLTLYAQWENLPSYTVKLMDNNEVLTSSCNTPISLPDRNCDGYTFVGWTKTWTEEQEEWTTTAPDIIEAGSYTPTANESLYPVYTKTEGGGSEPTAYSAGDVGSFIIASNVGNKWYAIPENPTLSSSKITGVEITVSQTAGGVNYVSTANAEGYTWTIADATNGQTISDGSKYIYHSNGGASGTNLTYGTSTSFTWKIEKENNGLTFKGMSDSTTNSRGLLFNGSVFGGYALSNEDASGYYRIQVLPIGGGSTTSYISVPECTIKPSRYLTPKHRGDSGGTWLVVTEW